MKAEEYRVEINRGQDPHKDGIIRAAHFQAVLVVGQVTGSYGASQMCIAQECMGALFALDAERARTLVKAWCDEMHGQPKDLAAENEALRRFVAAEEVHRAGRKS